MEELESKIFTDSVVYHKLTMDPFSNSVYLPKCWILIITVNIYIYIYD